MFVSWAEVFGRAGGRRREEVVEKSSKPQTKDSNYSVSDPKALKLAATLQLKGKRPFLGALFTI